MHDFLLLTFFIFTFSIFLNHFNLACVTNQARSLRIQNTVLLLDGIVRNDPKHDFSESHIRLFADTGTLIKKMCSCHEPKQETDAAFEELTIKLAQIRQSIIELSSVVAASSTEIPPEALGTLGVGIIGSNLDLAGMDDNNSNGEEEQQQPEFPVVSRTISLEDLQQEDDQSGRGLPKYVHGSRVCALLFLQLVEHLTLRSVRLYQSWQECETICDACEKRDHHPEKDQRKPLFRQRLTATVTAIFVVLLVVLLLAVQPPHVDAAHSRARIVIRRERENSYDRVISTFNSEGRLLQVEYAMEACQRGSTIVAAISSSSDKTDAPSTIYILVRSSSLDKVFRIDDHVLLAGVGLGGDTRYLAQYLRVQCQQFRHSFGEAPSVKQVAEMAAGMNHKLTRRAGGRPLGCTALIMGIDPSRHEDKLGRPRIFRTDPGGIYEEYTFCAVGKCQRDAMQKLQDIDQNEEKEKFRTTLVQSTFDSLELKKGDTFDIWEIQPCLGRRGNMQATCFLNLDRNKLDNS